MVDADDVPRLAYGVAAVLLAALVVCALWTVEAWPLSGWRLFSQVRRADQPGWTAMAVIDGVEQPVPFERLSRGYRGRQHLLSGFPGLSPAERESVCGAWADALLDQGLSVGAVTVYRTTIHTSLDGSPPVMSRGQGYPCRDRS